MLPHAARGKVRGMRQFQFPHLRALFVVSAALLSAAAPGHASAQPSPAAISAFNSYISSVESRLAAQHRTQATFLALGPGDEARLRHGELMVQQLTPDNQADFPGALLHDWRGTAFVPGATAAAFEHLMQNFSSYPQYFSPQVFKVKVLAHNYNHFQVRMRVRQSHVLTVVLDTTYDVTFGRLDPQHGYSISRSTQISEIDSPGTPAEHPVAAAREHGFLWRMNTYWSYEERDGGLYIQIESVSLTRSIPSGLGWIIGPYVKSIPRESLEFTLRSICGVLRRDRTTPAAQRANLNFRRTQ